MFEALYHTKYFLDICYCKILLFFNYLFIELMVEFFIIAIENIEAPQESAHSFYRKIRFIFKKLDGHFEELLFRNIFE